MSVAGNHYLSSGKAPINFVRRPGRSGKTVSKAILSAIGSKRRVGGLLLACSAAAFISPLSANASVVLVLSESGFPSLTLTDAATPGKIAFTGAYGDFSADITLAKSNSPGAAGNGLLSLKSDFLTNTGSSVATLDLNVADTGFNTPGTSASSVSLNSALGGTFTTSVNTDSIQYTSYADPNNNLLDSLASTPAPGGVSSTGSPLLTSPGGVAQAFSDQSQTIFTRSGVGTGAYSLAGLTTVSLAPGDSVISFSADAATSATVGNNLPEPTSAAIMLVGGGMLALRRRRA